VHVRPLCGAEDQAFQRLMQEHHYLGALAKIGNTLRYVAELDGRWVGLLSVSAPALKCAARDQWIGWDYRHQYDRLNLVANNSRFLILPGCHHKNLGSQILSRLRRRIQRDWQEHFGYPLLMLETFVDPARFHGTVYRAANWRLVGATQGYRRTRHGYSERPVSPKLVFVLPLQRNARALLTRPRLDERYQTGKARMKLTAEQMLSLYDFFTEIDDSRRAQGRKHPLASVLALAAAAVLCGMRGYKDISIWVQSLGQKARSRFRCRKRNGLYEVPSRTVIRNALIGVAPDQLDRALNAWNAQYGQSDESLAIDGKTMCNAIDENANQTHIMSAIGHQSGQCYTQKKSAHFAPRVAMRKNEPTR
jgi:GNAT superfamily N-acetyltransferase